MAGNSFGNVFKITTFGESHGLAIGGIIDGCPPNIELDLEAIQHDLDRRKPGQSSIVTQRKESDTVKFLQEFLKVKLLEHQLDLLLKTKIRNLKITRILKIALDQVMPIMFTNKNMVFAIIVVADVVLREKLQVA